MGKKCEVCNKRQPKYFINIHIDMNKEKIVEMCMICQKKYIKIREKHLVMAFNELVDISR